MVEAGQPVDPPATPDLATDAASSTEATVQPPESETYYLVVTKGALARPELQVFGTVEALAQSLFELMQQIEGSAAAAATRVFIFSGKRLFLVGESPRLLKLADGRLIPIGPPTPIEELDPDHFLLPASKR